MRSNKNGARRKSRSGKKDDYITPAIILAGILLALYYLYFRWQSNRITRDEIITVSVALAVSAVCFICYLPGAQRWFDRMEHERRDAQERDFWVKRTENERAQRLREQQAEGDRAKRHARRREEALQRQLEQSQSANAAEDQKLL